MVMFSGGAGSCEAGKRVVEMFGADNVKLLFADVLMEDEDLYRFLRDAAEYVGAPLIRIAEGRTPWQVFEDERMIGNSRVDPCSKILKREFMDKWCRENCDPRTTIIHTGLSWFEPDRIERNMKAFTERGWWYVAPMAMQPLLTNDEVLEKLRAAGLRPPRLYEMGFEHNNCGGFCVKAGQASFANLYRKMPERYLWHEAQEERLNALGIKGTIMVDRRGVKKGEKRKPLSMRQFRLRLEATGEFDVNDKGGCGCASL